MSGAKWTPAERALFLHAVTICLTPNAIVQREVAGWGGVTLAALPVPPESRFFGVAQAVQSIVEARQGLAPTASGAGLSVLVRDLSRALLPIVLTASEAVARANGATIAGDGA